MSRVYQATWHDINGLTQMVGMKLGSSPSALSLGARIAPSRAAASSESALFKIKKALGAL